MPKKRKPCIWMQNEDGCYCSSCHQMFEFNAGGPEDNHFAFCPYCGHPIEEQCNCCGGVGGHLNDCCIDKDVAGTIADAIERGDKQEGKANE